MKTTQLSLLIFVSHIFILFLLESNNWAVSADNEVHISDGFCGGKRPTKHCLFIGDGVDKEPVEIGWKLDEHFNVIWHKKKVFYLIKAVTLKHYLRRINIRRPKSPSVTITKEEVTRDGITINKLEIVHGDNKFTISRNEMGYCVASGKSRILQTGPAFVYNGSLYYNATKRKGGTLQQRGLRERLYKVFLDEEQRQFFAAICGESGEIKEVTFAVPKTSKSVAGTSSNVAN